MAKRTTSRKTRKKIDDPDNTTVIKFNSPFPESTSKPVETKSEEKSTRSSNRGRRTKAKKTETEAKVQASSKGSRKPSPRNTESKTKSKSQSSKKPTTSATSTSSKTTAKPTGAKTGDSSSAPLPDVKISQSVAILIDGNNIEMSLTRLTNNKSAVLNFDTVIPKILDGRGLNRLIYFREGKSISQKLADRLYTHYFGSVVPCHKSADIPLSIKATQLAEKVDTIIIFSGDSDYVELVRHLKSQGVRVEIAAIEITTAAILIDEADYYNPITAEDAFILY